MNEPDVLKQHKRSQNIQFIIEFTISLIGGILWLLGYI
jgi:hypothetical protein